MAGPKHPRRFTEEFKRQIVGLHNSGKPAHEIMAEYGLRKPALRRRANATNATGPSRAADNRTPEESRLIEPERENGRPGDRIVGLSWNRRAASDFRTAFADAFACRPSVQALLSSCIFLRF